MNDSALEEFRLRWQEDLKLNQNASKTNTSLASSRLERIESEKAVDEVCKLSVLASENHTPELKDVPKICKSTQCSLTSIDKAKNAGEQDGLSETQSLPRRTVLFPNSSGKGDDTSNKVQLSASETYEKGVEKERQGMLSDALVYYRKAFKLDPGVDKTISAAYRANIASGPSYEPLGTSVEESNYAKFVQVGADYDPKFEEASTELQEMTLMMASLRMPVETSTSKEEHITVTDISSLPEEILQQVLSYAMVSDAGNNFTSMSMTCQKFFLLLHDQSIWRELCYSSYHDQVYTGDGTLLRADSVYMDYVSKLNKEALEDYNMNWKRMFIEKPRIRYNGIYISTCHYTRPGVREESLDWTSPIHLVTYFRFLRFFPNGECLSLLTPAEPKEVVHSIAQGTKLKGVQKGRWSMTRSGQVSIEANGPSNYLFFMELQIKSSSRGRQNKLAWSKFFGVHPVSAEITHFKNDRSHYFHKVKSYV